MDKKVRNANIEWLRVISMLMIVMLHVLGKGNLLRSMYNIGGANVYIAWALESLSIVAVNIFFLISGYVLVDSGFKTKRLFSILIQMSLYGLIIYYVYSRQGMDMEGAKNSLLQAALPIHMKTYWFMTVYVLLYMMLPFITAGIKTLNQKQHLAIIIILIIFECAFKSVLPVKLDIDGAAGGYSLEWFITLFLIAAYIKRYGFKVLNKPFKGLLTYFSFAALILLEQVYLDKALMTEGRFTYIQSISYDYNHILVLIASLGLFSWAINKKEPPKPVAAVGRFLSPMALGVYIIHEQSLIRYEWPEWFKLSTYMDKTPVMFLLSLIGVALLVYVVCSLIDLVRLWIFKGIGFAFRKTFIAKAFNKLDDILNGRAD